jgi:hypothetical protein
MARPSACAKHARVFAAALTGLVLAGCATMDSPRTAALSASFVEVALTHAPAELRAAADRGEAGPQLSYSIVLRYGLNGTAPNAVAADVYEKAALASRGTTTTAIYVPDGKHSGHTQLISIPRYEISAAMGRAADVCADALRSGLKADVITTQCGGPDAYLRLADLWSKAAPRA